MTHAQILQGLQGVYERMVRFDLGNPNLPALKGAIDNLTANTQEAWVAALLNAPNPDATPAVGGEPVAWRVRLASGNYQVTSYSDTAAMWRESGAEVEPLYASQPASPLRGSALISKAEAWLRRYEPSTENRTCKCAGSFICVYHSGAEIIRALSAPAAGVEREALIAARPHVQEMSMRLPEEAAEDCVNTLNQIDAALAAQPDSPLRGRESMITALAEKFEQRPSRRTVEYATECVDAMLAASPPEQPHKIETDGPPCPTCGFKITSRKPRPFIIEDDAPPEQPAVTATGTALAEAWKRYPQTGGTHRQAFIEGTAWAAGATVSIDLSDGLPHLNRNE